MYIAAIGLGGLALAWAIWHLTYVLGGRARHDLEVRDRLRRYTAR